MITNLIKISDYTPFFQTDKVELDMVVWHLSIVMTSVANATLSSKAKVLMDSVAT